MSCKTCKCKTTPCGCEDQGLTTPPSCGSINCPEPEPCAEIFSDCCIVHSGDSYAYIDAEIPTEQPQGNEIAPQYIEPPSVKPPFIVNQNERLCDFFQRYLAYNNCDSFTNDQIPYGLHSNIIASTSINIGWTAGIAVESYDIYYAPVSTGVFVAAGSVGPSTTPNATITGLTPNTEYYVCVRSYIEGEPSCLSVSLIIKTKL